MYSKGFPSIVLILWVLGTVPGLSHMRFVTLYDGFQELVPDDIHTHITHRFIICATSPAEVATFAPAGQIRVKSDRCRRVCYYYAEMLRLSVVQTMRDVSSETPMCYD